MKMIRIGDKVETIDDQIKGTVIDVSESVVTIEDEFGFEQQFEKTELIHRQQEPIIESAIFNSDIEAAKREKAIRKRQSKDKTKPKDQQVAKFIVDLHIHHLTDSTKGMTNYDMLNLQIDTARKQLEFAMRKRIPKMVFIHGVGEGVLRQELETLLGRYNNLQFYDADYKTYGFGATEVRIFQNLQP
jgi:dsDNA-specific endonuclease/ATPase MutS2